MIPLPEPTAGLPSSLSASSRTATLLNAHAAFNLVTRANPNAWTQPYTITRGDFRPIVAAVLAETLLYGIHLVLYVFSSSVLLRAHRRKMRTRISNARLYNRDYVYDNGQDRPPSNASGNNPTHTPTRGSTVSSAQQLNRRSCAAISSILILRRIRARIQALTISLSLMSFFATTIMFILATADIGVSYSALLNRYSDFVDEKEDTTALLNMVYPKFLIHLVNNVIADILLITRCYIIWSYNRILGYTAVFLLVVGTGFVSEATTSPKLKVVIGPYIFVVFFLNLLLTLLTAEWSWGSGEDMVDCERGRKDDGKAGYKAV
ncbi:hypothetical protein NP233_g2885 [Leucocoprinus birnbaumii]|uniref:Uncharacterized protein n=1 Tax=Leucocoprinus birnbaumii TaxID=56174 RepID=A0AAD5W3U7_9AGAR|nr:hypothetical protein NP233_g2885 [Leucocoprinus birnbaumii]